MFVILTTVSKKSDAERLATLLIEEKLAGCVNIIKTDSVYRWKNKIKKEPEFLLLIKTGKHYDRVERFIKKVHPYELPEIVALPLAKGYKRYLNWLTGPR